MKFLACIFLLCLTVGLWSQQNNNRVIKVRKNIPVYDSVITFEKMGDSSYSGTISIPVNQKYLSGFGKKSVYFRKRYVYYFNKSVSKKIRKKANFMRNSGPFWKKIKRKTRLNKLHYFRETFLIKRVDTMQYTAQLTQKMVSVLERTSRELISIEPIDTLFRVTKTVFINSSYQFISNGDTLNFSSRNSAMQNCEKVACVFDDLTQAMKKTENESKLLRYMVSNKTIYKDTYLLAFDLKNTTTNEIWIIKNSENPIKCSYTIKGHKINIENCPLPEISEGRINRRKSMIKFKIHTARHVFINSNK